MSEVTESRHGQWSSRWMFVLAAAGSAVGLGNIWKFPYIAGENGGGAFVLVYLVCIAVIGVPIMIGEVFLGKLGRQSPINSMITLSQRFGRSTRWGLVGWLGVVTGVFILSFYAVIAGWVLAYVFRLASGEFTGVTAEYSATTFANFTADPVLGIFWYTMFMIPTVVVVARGVNRGLEVAVRWLMPLLLVILLVLLGYGIFAGGFMQSVEFLFHFDMSQVSQKSVIQAMGHAFFTLSLGMGAIMAYGAYVPANVPIKTTVITISLLDTAVALVAGLAIFSIVFAHGMEPTAGPGLLFEVTPVAFGSLPFGALFGTLFFLLVTFAAFTSAISIIEPAVAYFVERLGISRAKVATAIGGTCWIVGLGCALSFNVGSDFHVLPSLTIFDFFDKLTQYFLLPIGGFLIAIYVGWRVPDSEVMKSVGLNKPWQLWTWKILIGVLAPLGVLAVFAWELRVLFGA